MSDGPPNVGMGGMVVYKPVVNTGPGGRIAAHNPTVGAPAEPIVDDSSIGSIQSIGSVGSILSIGSVGSVLSIGSAGSVLSIGSAGSILSIGSVGSIGSIGSGMSVGSIGGWAERPGALVRTGATALTIAALWVAATGG